MYIINTIIVKITNEFINVYCIFLYLCLILFYSIVVFYIYPIGIENIMCKIIDYNVHRL